MTDNSRLDQSEEKEEQKTGSVLDAHEKRRAALKRMAKAVIGGAGVMLLPPKRTDAQYVPPVYYRYSSFTTYQHNSYGNYYGNYTNYGGGKYSSYYNSKPAQTTTPYKSYADYNDYSSCAGEWQTTYNSGYSNYGVNPYGGSDGAVSSSYTVCFYDSTGAPVTPSPYSNYSSTACKPKTVYSDTYSSSSAKCEYCDSNDEKQNFSYTVCYNSTL